MRIAGIVRFLKVAILAAVMQPTAITLAQDPMAFWQVQRKGANCQNWHVTTAYWHAASDLGLDFVRLIPNNWAAAERDFLIGDADDFTGLNEPDMARLLTVLDEAAASGVKVLLTTFSLPGARWRQHNNDQDDYRLWHDSKFQEQAGEFWRQLAERLRGHPAIVGYNLLNEPHPAREKNLNSAGEAFRVWLGEAKDTPADLNAFYRRVIRAIRSVDASTPIVLDSWIYATPEGFQYLEPVDDQRVLYAFHYYEPWIYTTYRVNKGRFAYPARMPAADSTTSAWDIGHHRENLQVVADWSDQYSIPANRIIGSEFGVDRRVEGAESYLSDIITLFNENGWHWAFYIFRNDGAWTGMDYELGKAKVDWHIWEAKERGEDLSKYKKRTNNPLWDAILAGLNN